MASAIRPLDPLAADGRWWRAAGRLYMAVGYFFLVLHFLGPWLASLHNNHVPFYALVSVALILGQAVLLESLTTFLIRLIRGRSE